MYFDSHAHYCDTRFDTDRYELLAAMPGLGVGCILNAGSDMESSRASVLLAEAFPHVYAAVGVHPHEVSAMADGDMDELERLAAHPKVAAVGEIGLDYYYDHSPRDVQKKWLRRQLALALKVNLPVVIHAREAAADSFDIIKESGVRQGVIHCYSGSLEMALEYIKLGYCIGIGGVVTFDKSKKLPGVTARLPLDSILIETDAPYQTPVPHRGKRNDSSYLKYIVNEIAAVKGLTPETVAEAAYKNAASLFHI